jgi:predicted CXXCH cytochrome family protein
MPLIEGHMRCSSCHEPHGSTNVRLLRVGNWINESCVSCHTEKRGPFLFEHAAGRESCITCHDPHGSLNDRMLVAKLPMLCQRCHIGTRHPEKLAGVIALSCYLPRSSELATARTTANQATPIFMAHGTQDPVVPYPLGDESRRLLEGAGYSVEWHAYPMPHGLCEPEVAHLRSWLKRVCEA